MRLDGGAHGAWLQLPGPATAELMASAGFDFVAIDQQHGLVGDDALLPMLMALGDVPSLVRPTVTSADAIGRALDRGADGVVVPLVDSVADAAAAVAACHHPPRGTRSYGPTRQGWRGERPDPVCVVMIETVGAVEAVADIAAVDGVDALFVGPSDLALAHGMPTSAQNGDADYDALLDRIVASAGGKPVGIYTASAAHARRFRGRGFTFTAGPSEATLLRAAAVEHVRDARG
jgi:4-hydroxy-2-oxoheptanedioate aldolase